MQTHSPVILQSLRSDLKDSLIYGKCLKTISPLDSLKIDVIGLNPQGMSSSMWPCVKNPASCLSFPGRSCICWHFSVKCWCLVVRFGSTCRGIMRGAEVWRRADYLPHGRRRWRRRGKERHALTSPLTFTIRRRARSLLAITGHLWYVVVYSMKGPTLSSPLLPSLSLSF